MQLITLLFCFLSYILFLVSVLRVTYDSQLLPYVPPSPQSLDPPISKLAVVIIIDGLGQSAWDYTMSNRSSFLMNITRERGISGVVKANAPTESRPRHTAIFAGFEENIANIKAGWSKSVQPFESVFNNVDVSWAFGMETVLNYFDADIRRISHGNSTPDSQVLQDFLTSADGIVQELSMQTKDVNESTRGKIVFLHFDSTDAADHIEGYSTPNYLEAVVQADNCVHAVFDFFQKELSKEVMNATTFIVTSDHGVLQYGGHGGDSIGEAYVPIFMWGSGIVREQSRPVLQKLDSKSGYEILLNQVDICPLIASLLGIKMPSNSMGSLPVDLLDVNPARKLQLLLSNNRHLWRLLQTTIERIKSTSFFPFLKKEQKEPWMVRDLSNDMNQLIHEHKRTQDMLISKLNSYRWFTWWTFSPFWISVTAMISLNLVSAALMSEPLSEGLHRVRAKCLLILILLVECVRVTWASPRELTIVMLVCLLGYTFLDGAASTFRKRSETHLPQSKPMMESASATALFFKFAILFLSFIFMLGGFYVKPLFCLSVLSALTAQIISTKLDRTFLAYLCAVSSALIFCIILIEYLRTPEKPEFKMLIFAKTFSLLTLALWVIGNALFARNLAGVGRLSSLAHPTYTTLLTHVQFLLALSIYLFGLDLFSDMARKICSQLWHKLPSTATMLLAVIPILLLVNSHVKILAWQRRSIGSERQSAQNQNAVAVFLLFLISQSFSLLTLRGHGSWAEIGSSLVYTLTTPALCLLTGLLLLTLRRT